MGSGYFFVQGAMQAMSIESLGSMVRKGATLNFFWSVRVVCNLLDFFPQMFHSWFPVKFPFRPSICIDTEESSSATAMDAALNYEREAVWQHAFRRSPVEFELAPWISLAGSM